MSLLKRLLQYTVFFALLLFIIYASYLYATVTTRFEGERSILPIRIYSDVLPLYTGLDIVKMNLFAKLNRLGYTPVTGAALKQGEYRFGQDYLDIYLKPFSYPEKENPSAPYRIKLNGSRIISIINMNTLEETPYLEIEPEILVEILGNGREERVTAKLKDIPQHLIYAVISIEDERFYRHFGIDPISIMRAMLINLTRMSIVQGGSTITQQLAKNYFLTPQRTLIRKMKEALIAVILELKYSKDEILEAYLNEIYLGQKGPTPIYGVQSAARFFFDKDVKNLTLSEAALIAGLIKSPNRFSPFRSKMVAMERRNLVLKRMFKLGKINEHQYRMAIKEPINVKGGAESGGEAPYFLDYVRHRIEEIYSDDIWKMEGLKIFTTLDPDMQRNAERAVTKGLAELEKNYRSLRNKNIQAAIIAIEPETGYIKAMVGGRNYYTSQFNRAVDGMRQPGSVIKPFVYLAALSPDENGMPPLTPSAIVEDSPITLTYDGQEWTPRNYEDEYLGDVTIRIALEKSLNIPTVKISQQIGLKRVIDTFKKVGLGNKMDEVPSVVLGSQVLSPMDVARAFCVLANKGYLVQPTPIKYIVDKNGRYVEFPQQQKIQVADPRGVFIVTKILQGVIERGTGYQVRRMGINKTVAGKTGTTSDFKDAWFAGYTPEIVSVAWVGFDEGGKSVGLSGAQAALPLWVDFMKEVLNGKPDIPFNAPPGVVSIKIDRLTGLLATEHCPDVIDEYFIEGTEPREYCKLHQPGITDGLNRMIDWIKGLLREQKD